MRMHDVLVTVLYLTMYMIVEYLLPSTIVNFDDSLPAACYPFCFNFSMCAIFYLPLMLM